MDRRNIKILIANKSQSMRTIIRDFLKNSGFSHMSSTENGGSAFLLAKENQTDLMIADFELADMNGFDLLRQVREEKKTRDIPFILVSSESEKKRVAQAGEHRVSAYVIKPFSQETLLEKVNRVLEIKINPGEGLMCFLRRQPTVRIRKLGSRPGKIQTGPGRDPIFHGRHIP